MHTDCKSCIHVLQYWPSVASLGVLHLERERFWGACPSLMEGKICDAFLLSLCGKRMGAYLYGAEQLQPGHWTFCCDLTVQMDAASAAGEHAGCISCCKGNITL